MIQATTKRYGTGAMLALGTFFLGLTWLSAPALPHASGRRGYGAQFWLLDTLEDVPAGTYTTSGNKGQYVTVIPRHDMVVVRTGVDPNGRRWRQDEFINAVVDVFD